MKKPEISHSIQGSWRGHYFYLLSNDSFGFEAVFVESGGMVSGNILDDGRLGEADVAGSFSYPVLKFQKIYRNRALDPVHYQGMMSEDGNEIGGTWALRSKAGGAASGRWVMRRFTDADTIFQSQEEQKEKEEPVSTVPARL